MKMQIRLKWFLALSFLSLVVVLVVVYSLLSAHFFVRGMDSIIAGNMVQVVASYVAAVSPEERRRLASFSGYQISPDWRQMPSAVRNAFALPQYPGVLHKYDRSGWFAPPDEVFFVMRVTHDDETYFISHRVTHDNASPLVGRNAAQNIQLLIGLSLLILLILAVIVWKIFRRIEGPVNALGQWARSLSQDTLDQIPPDFFYPELNELALLIKNSLSSVQAGLEREHRFLRHSSHELRSPISVIRNNVELMYKLRQGSAREWNPREKQIVKRIDRASLTMKHLTETLLWLSRESEADLPVRQVDLEALVRDVAGEAQYLLNDKAVEVDLVTSPHEMTVAEIPARIVLSNLIRNAFQHTWQGRVCITQTEGRVEVVNDGEESVDRGQDLGFGLGLQLTEQLTKKLKWDYTHRYDAGKYRAVVTLG